MFDLVKQMINKVFGDGASKAVADSVYFQVNESGEVWSFVSNIYDKYLVPIGFCILVFMFFYALTEKLSAEGFTFETAGKMIIKLLIFCGFMEIGLQLALGLLNISNAVIQGINQDDFAAAASKEAVDNVLITLFGTTNPNFDGFWGTIAEFVMCGVAMVIMLLPWLVTLICEALINIIILTREIEIFARAAFMPVAIGDSYNGMSSGAVRYIKSFLAVCLQGALIVVILRISSEMSMQYLIENMDADWTGLDATMSLVIMPIIFKIASAGLILKSLPLAKEICGTS